MSGEAAGPPQTQTGALCVFWFGRWIPAETFFLFKSLLSFSSVLVSFSLPKPVFLGHTSPVEVSRLQAPAVAGGDPGFGIWVCPHPAAPYQASVCPSRLAFLFRDMGCERLPAQMMEGAAVGGAVPTAAVLDALARCGPGPSSSVTWRLQSKLEWPCSKAVSTVLLRVAAGSFKYIWGGGIYVDTALQG